MWISKKAVSETRATWGIAQTAAVARLCLVGRRSPGTSALTQAPGSGAEVLRASLYLCCHPVFCTVITRALKQGLPLAPSALLINQMFPAVMSETQPNIPPDIRKHLESLWPIVWAIRNEERAKCSEGSRRRTLLLLGSVNSLLAVIDTRVCQK